VRAGGVTGIDVRRAAFILCAACSLAVCVATLALWARSRTTLDSVGYSHSAPPGPPTVTDWGWHLTSANGVLTLVRFVDDYTDPAVFDSAFQSAILICAVLLVLGGVVSWFTIPASLQEAATDSSAV